MTHQTFNSAAKASRYLRRHKESWFNFYRSDSERAAYKNVMLLLQKAVHFSLPDDGKILNDNLVGLKNVEARLPYPVITLEFDTVYKDGNVKTLILAAEGNSADLHITLDDPEDCFVTFLLFSIKEAGPTWLLNPLMFKITHDWEVSDKNTIFNALIFNIFPSVIEAKLEEDKDCMRKFEETIAHSSLAVLELCEALTCSNVEIGTLQEASRKNNKRILQGKLPLLETKTLVINTQRQPGTGKSYQLEGDKCSPRQHLRRGHIRFLKSDRFKNKQGQKIWVNSAVVGSRGKIRKNYEVR